MNSADKDERLHLMCLFIDQHGISWSCDGETVAIQSLSIDMAGAVSVEVDHVSTWREVRAVLGY